MDHVRPAPLPGSSSDRGTSTALSLAATGEAEPSGEPDSPGPRSPSSGADASADLFFDQPFGAVAGFLLGLVTLLVPLVGVVMDRPLLPGHQESSERRFRPVAVAESPGNRGPGKTAPDR